jgi:hypothetical protein
MQTVRLAGYKGANGMYIPRVIDEIPSKVRAVLVNRKQSPESDLACDAALDTVMAEIGKSIAVFTETERQKIRNTVRIRWSFSDWPTEIDKSRRDTIPVRSAVLVDYVNHKIKNSGKRWSNCRAAEVGNPLDSSGRHQVAVTHWAANIPENDADEINQQIVCGLGEEWRVQA